MFFETPFQMVVTLVGMGFSFAFVLDFITRCLSSWKYLGFFSKGKL